MRASTSDYLQEKRKIMRKKKKTNENKEGDRTSDRRHDTKLKQSTTFSY